MEISGVRSLAEQKIRFDEGLNLLVGDNGQGKSSVLESVYLLGTSRSYRTSRLAEVVTIGGGPARIAADGDHPGESLAVLLSGKERRFLKNGKVVAPGEYIGTLDVVALSGDLAQAFRRQPAERRRFLDRMALATYPAYLEDLRELRRTCEQRALLASTGTRGAERETWDARAAEVAVPVAKRRMEMAAALERHLRDASIEIFPEGRSARVRLVSHPALDPADEAAYREGLKAAFARQEASARRETPAGPMRDDLAIEVEGRDVLKYGSAGQMRSLLTAAVLAEMRRLRELKGRYPVLVLDDVDADLDEGRYAALLAALGDAAQVVAATSKGGLAAAPGSHVTRYSVVGGAVTPEDRVSGTA